MVGLMAGNKNLLNAALAAEAWRSAARQHEGENKLLVSDQGQN
jgi:hypothetical protein